MKKIVVCIFLLIYSLGFSAPQGEASEYIEYHSNGVVKLKGSYLQDKKIGFWNLYREDGSQKTEFSYIDGDDFFGVNTYDKKGILRSSGFVKNLKQDGEWFFYDIEGKLILKINFKDGLKDGLFIAYSENKAPIIVGFFKDDNLEDIRSIK
ncbi:MAG: toxin-antitoxin system YwqK family antitoxin [Fusobacteriaceae bacterium]